ncbi:serine hydrolase [Robertkochia aurantiaca]|uniref:serine hydrolase n=1 Tax=Robertkochia aurantiaca TaxID=2873700 RepID=UPI001CCF443B|nr:serine hydrolase [Robertkochia sp. 3YJGBD-33]
MKPTYALLAAILLLQTGCQERTTQNSLETALETESPVIQEVMQEPEKYELQILLTTVDRKGDSVILTDHNFGVDDSRYFYPASTVKLPAAILALEKLEELESYDRNTPFYMEGDTVQTTIGREIEKIFAVSDNDSFNLLYEFVGPEVMNQKLREKGISDVRIVHRLSVADADNPNTRTLIFQKNDSTLAEFPGSFNNIPEKPALTSVFKGKGYMSGDSLITEPMDFSSKNYLPLGSSHAIMKRLFFPTQFDSSERFHLSEEDMLFLQRTMRSTPSDLGYSKDEYHDSYVKFFLYGDSKEDIPDHIEIYNKEGDAYGYLTDIAYIKDTKNGVEFILSATIHVNENRIYNDNNYQYDSIGKPFFAELGRQIHQAEIQKDKS